MPAFTAAAVTAGEPLTPATDTGPVAVSETVFAATVPPLSLVIVLTSVNKGAVSLLMMVQVAI